MRHEEQEQQFCHHGGDGGSTSGISSGGVENRELPDIKNKVQRLIEQVSWMENAPDKCKVELSNLRKQIAA